LCGAGALARPNLRRPKSGLGNVANRLGRTPRIPQTSDICDVDSVGLTRALDAPEPFSGYIASLRKYKDPIPTDDNTLIASLDLEYAEVARR
jgi:hypothetical protein